MPIEQGPHGVDDWILLIIAFHQHGVKRSDTAVRKASHSLHKPSQHREDRGGVALRGRWLASGETNFALSHGKASERVHDKKHILAPSTEILSHRSRCQSCTDSEQGRLIRSRDNHHGAAAAFFTERCKEFADLASALADQRQHGQVRHGSASHHANQRTLADSAATKNADSLAAAAGQEAVDGADAAGERLINKSAIQCRRSESVDWHGASCRILTRRVQRLAGCIDDSPQKFRSDTQRWPGSPSHNAVPKANALRLLQTHRQHVRAAKADDFPRKHGATGIQNFAGFPHRTEWSSGFHQISDHLSYPACPADGGTGLQPGAAGIDRGGRRHCESGFCASRSKKPFSTSFNCASSPMSAVPISVSSRQLPAWTEASPATSRSRLF